MPRATSATAPLQRAGWWCLRSGSVSAHARKVERRVRVPSPNPSGRAMSNGIRIISTHNGAARSVRPFGKGEYEQKRPARVAPKPDADSAWAGRSPELLGSISAGEILDEARTMAAASKNMVAIALELSLSVHQCGTLENPGWVRLLALSSAGLWQRWGTSCAGRSPCSTGPKKVRHALRCNVPSWRGASFLSVSAQRRFESAPRPSHTLK